MNSRLLQILRSGFKSLLLHKLRSGLAMLGILIGVTAVIWLVALGEGVSYQAQQQIRDLGATNIIVKSTKPPPSGESSFIVNYGLKRADFERILMIPTVRRAVPMREIAAEARAETRSAEIQLLGCTPAYLEINHLEMARGRFLQEVDLERADNYAVLAADTADKLFPYQNPIGRNVHLFYNTTSQVFRVVGVTKSRLPSAAIGGSLAGRSYNQDIYIPLSTFRQRIGDIVVTARSGSREGEELELSQVTVTVGDVQVVEETASVIEKLLEKYHKDPDYAIVVPKELLRQAEMLRMMFNVLLVLIAGISLVVGGIGIMNIMLATVTERTREIGVRRAMGATRGDVIRQFLAETVVLAATGGVAGVLLGFLCQPAVAGVMYGLEHWANDVWTTLPSTIQKLEPIVAPWSIIAAFLISVGVGVMFGLYPARRAALMDPIEALRHE